MNLPSKVFLSVLLLLGGLIACQAVPKTPPAEPTALPEDGYLTEVFLPESESQLIALASDNAIRINAGGPAVTVNGVTWNQDTFYSDGRAYINTNISNVANTNADELYLTERVSADRGDSVTYSIPLPAAGTYEVRLHFAEIWVGAPGGGDGGAGSRVFDVHLEDDTVLRNYDVYAEVGAVAATVESIEVAVSDKVLDLEFSAPDNYPKVSAIEVIPQDSADAPPPPTDSEVLPFTPTVETTPSPNSNSVDDPAIWIHPSDPSQSLIIGTIKQTGLATYNLDGSQHQLLTGSDMNNVDIRQGFVLSGGNVDLIAATNRSNNTIALYRMNVGNRQLESVGAIQAGIPDIYGICMYRSPESGKFYVFVTSNSGQVRQFELRGAGNGQVNGNPVRTLSLGSITEGCVADDELGHLYVSEERVGVWKYGAEPNAGTTGSQVDRVGSSTGLVADVEGLTLYYGENGQGYLIVSSQGNNSFIVYEREGNNAYVRNFRVAAGNGIDGVEETDGIDVTHVPLGPDFPYGVFVAHDDQNSGGNQNFKLIPWQAIMPVDRAGDEAPTPAPTPSEPTPAPSEPAPTPPQTPADGVIIRPSDDAQAIVRAHPAGTTFVFGQGTHRFTRPIVPRDGDSFIGETGAVISGARRLTEFSRESSLWVVSGQTQQGPVRESCLADSPRCNYPEDLFIDNVPLKHVASRSAVVPGSWFFDYGANKIYFADDPNGRTVETSVTDAAFIGGANNVTIRGLVIEKFANPVQHGVIHAYYTSDGENWHIEGNEVRLNHSVGIMAGYGARIMDNYVHHNGQLGIGSSHGVGTLIEGNEIAYNNFAGYRHWGTGGAKFAQTDGLVVRNNYVHNNDGPGLWSDIDNIRILYEHNLVENNAGDGIFHELGYSAVIRYNTVLNNGYGRGYEQYCYSHCAGIYIYNSSDVEVYENVVLGNWNGITARHDLNRVDGGAYGPRSLTNLFVRDNTVEMLFHSDGIGPQGERGTYGFSGVVGGSTNPVFTKQANNRFENNTYYVENSSGHFAWAGGTNRSFSQWQVCANLWAGCTQDRNGTMIQGRAPSHLSTMTVR